MLIDLRLVLTSPSCPDMIITATGCFHDIVYLSPCDRKTDDKITFIFLYVYMIRSHRHAYPRYSPLPVREGEIQSQADYMASRTCLCSPSSYSEYSHAGPRDREPSFRNDIGVTCVFTRIGVLNAITITDAA